MGVSDRELKNFCEISVDRIDELFARNVDVISSQEQAAIATSRVLIAGCGSVGGSLVESLVRLGATQAVLADPEVFDITNINRQSCSLADVGRSKAIVLAERARSINPLFQPDIYSDGLTETNIGSALEGITVAFDAIDASTSPWIKYRLHEIAAERRIPVVSGFDFGGKACLYVFDYRRFSARPFYGRATAEAHRKGDLAQCLRWLRFRHFPSDFLSVIQSRMGSGEPWPQVAYCVMAMGALATRGVVELAMNRKVPHVVSFDVHDAFRGPISRASQIIRFPVAMARAYRASRVGRMDRVCGMAGEPALPRLVTDDFVLRRVLEAMIQAPSPHNCQPWRFVISGQREIDVRWNSSRSIPAVDPDHFAIAYSLGAAIEAASSVAEIDFTPAQEMDFNSVNYSAGIVRVKRLLVERYTRGFALLAHRRTFRGELLDVPHSQALASRCDQLAITFGARAVFRRVEDDTLVTQALSGARRLFARVDYLAELLNHMRLSSSECEQDPTGFTRASLQLNRLESWFLSILRRRRTLARMLMHLGLSTAFARAAVRDMKEHREFLVISTSRWTNSGRVDAGRALMRVWLELTDNGLACQPVDFPISHQSGRRTVASMFGLPSSERPIALLRVGRPRSAPPSASRLPLASFCEMAPAMPEERYSEARTEGDVA